MVKSTRKPKSRKPAKPYPEFPLFPHATKRWAKKIKGRTVYFGPWDDPQGALDKYLAQKDDLHAGRKPREEMGGFTVADLGNEFMNFKRQAKEAGELSPRTWADYKVVTDMLVEHFGKFRLVEDLRQEDFAALRSKLAKRCGPVRLGNTVQRVRTIFKYAYDAERVDKPVRFGPGFKKPSKKTMRLEKAARGSKLFSREEILSMVDSTGVPLKAMILLGVNAGLGNADCGNLRLRHVDLDTGLLDYPRPKTGVARKAVLWPETVQAIRDALAKRPAPKDPANGNLIFITQQGFSWTKDIADSPITKELRKLLDKLGIKGRRNFYALRHVFRTTADESKDQPAVDLVMGHESPHMSSVYRETIARERLQAVSDYVRGWLFSTAVEHPDVLPLQRAANQ